MAESAKVAGKLIALLLLAGAAAARAAVIEGNVVERQTGRALAYARVVLVPVHAAGSQVTGFTDSRGRFSIQTAAGAYVLSAERRGYALAWYGQKRWNSPGTPIVVEKESRFTADVRLSRLGAISGEVLDENGIGLPDFAVHAYRDAKPLQLAGQGVTDDRGYYRIAGLQPGRYRVRTGTKQLQDGAGLLPTFFGNSASPEASQAIEVHLDAEAEGTVITPVPGQVMRLNGQVNFWGAVSVFLYSELGRKMAKVDATGRFAFNELSPGAYDLIAESSMGGQSQVGYARIWLRGDLDGVRLDPAPAPTVQFRCENSEGKPLDARNLSLLVKRNSPPDEPRLQRLACGASATVSVGTWQISISTPPNYYVSSVLVQRKPSGSDEFQILPGEKIEVTLVAAGRPASLRGVVTGQGEQPAVGAMVFLRALEAGLERRAYGKGVARTDLSGGFVIDGLPPGRYLVTSSFDVQSADEIDWSNPSLKTVELEEGRQAVVALVE